MASKTTSLTVRLSSDLAQRLRAAVARRQMSLSAAVREALEVYMAGHAGPSFLEQAHDQAGSLGGPTDLSSNRRHLAGFGRSSRRKR